MSSLDPLQTNAAHGGPAARAIGLAACVITVALGCYAVAATFDRWPELVMASWGAALGAGMAINAIALRETDGADAEETTPYRRDTRAALQHQLCSLLVALAAWQTAVRENIAWTIATIILGIAWAWTFPRLVSNLERASLSTIVRAYARAFQLFALALAAALVYASIAVETAWLPRPSVPADLQAFLWLAIVEFAGLPLTLTAVRTKN